MKISTATSVLSSYLLDEAIEKVLSIGFDGVDIWCGRPHLHRKDYPENSINSLGKKIKSNALEITSVMPAFLRYPYSLCSPIETVLSDSIGYMLDCIDNAKMIGAKSVLVPPVKSLIDQSKEDARRIFVRSLEKVSEYADLKMIPLNIEVLNEQLSDFACRTKDVVQIMREIGSDKNGIVLDTGHLNMTGENAESALEEAGDLLRHVHIHDNNKGGPQFLIPGEGDFDFAGFNRMLKAINYTGFVSLELGAQYAFAPEEALREALAKTKKLMS